MSSKIIEQLYRGVFENPEDVPTRLVLADALQESGDPRGELITLQHQRAALKQGPSKRERELIKKHEATLLGRLDPAVLRKEQIDFELGFAARVAFRNHSKGRERIGDPWWSTVQWLDVKDTDTLNRAGPLLLSEPVRKWLRTAWNVRLFDALAVVKQTKPVMLREILLQIGIDEAEKVFEFFDAARPVFPDLRFVVHALTGFGARTGLSNLDRILDSDLAQHLDVIIFRADINIWSEASMQHLAERLGAGGASRPRGPLRVAFSTRAGRITLPCRQDDRSNVYVNLVVQNGDALANQLTTLVHPKMKRVHLSGHTQSPADVALLRRAAEAKSLELLIESDPR